jgi:putative aminopeptidase FrvX
LLYHRRVTKYLLAILLSVFPLSAQVRFHPVDKTVLLQRLASAPNKNADRQQVLEKMFVEVGCQTSEQPLKHSKLANVICVLPGDTSDEIVVGGHVDKVDKGMGIVDDWSGSSLLPTLYESLKSLPRRHTIVFVGFTDEEIGLVGSRYYATQLTSEQRSHVKAMVNVECLGMTKTKVWATHSDTPLLNMLAAVAKAMNYELAAVNVEKVGTADSESFAAVKIPRITIHTVTQENLGVLHSINDNMKAIHADDYYENYMLIAGYLASIDQWLDKPAVSTAQSK